MLQYLTNSTLQYLHWVFETIPKPNLFDIWSNFTFRDNTNSRSDRCEDLDECAMGLSACFHGASCVNTLGSYKCVCGSGYHEVDGVCEDIDECLSNGRVNRQGF